MASHQLEITAIAWSPDSSKIVSCSLDAKIIVSDTNTGNKIIELDVGNKVVGLCWDPFDKFLACLRFDN